MYHEVLVPVDNSQHSGWAVDRAIELCQASTGTITGNHVYAARLHDVRFRQLETGLPAQFQSPEDLRHQRKVHDKLIEKGLQLIADSFLDDTERRCGDAGVPIKRQLLEGTNFEEIIREANGGGGRLPSLIGFDPAVSDKYDGHAVRDDIDLDGNGRLVAEPETPQERVAGSTEREYDLVVLGAHGIGRQPSSQLGGVAKRVVRKLDRDVLVVRDGQPLQNGRWMVCVDGSPYSFKAMRIALEMAREFGAKLFVCSAFDVEYHHVVFGSIKEVLSAQAAKVFKFEEQEALHNTIIDKGMLRLCQAHIKRAETIASEFPEVEIETQVLIGKPFQCTLQWVEEVDPSLLIISRHGSHRIEGTDIGSQAEELLRLSPTNLLVVGTVGVRADDIPWIEEDGETGLEWLPSADVRMLRTPPFAQGIARKAVEEFVLDRYWSEGESKPIVTDKRLDEAIEELLPTHMQLIMGIGTAEELALSEVRAEEAMSRTVVDGSDADPEPETPTVDALCPHSGRSFARERTATDPVVWTREAFERLSLVPLIARPLARNTVERFAAQSDLWRITTDVMDENKQAMVDTDEFDADTMLVMFRELQSKQLKAAAEGVDGMTDEMRNFIEEAKTSGTARCPVRDVVDLADKCPVDLSLASPEAAREAVDRILERERSES